MEALSLSASAIRSSSLVHKSFLPCSSLKFRLKRSSFTVRAKTTDGKETLKRSEDNTRAGTSSGVDSDLSFSSKASSKGIGFGPSSTSSRREKSGGVSNKGKRRGERAPIIRRTPVEKPNLLSEGNSDLKQDSNENAFLLTWLALGIIIFIEGIVLAASGFLPDEWDQFFVKYLYPSFTPTVILFVGGTVVYGVRKFLKGEQRKS